MTPLTVFEICAAIAVATIVIPYLIFGDGIILLIIIFPATAAEAITGERGLDLGRKSFVYLFFLYLFVLTEVLILATILFGGYCLFWGYPDTAATTAVIQSPQLSEVSTLIIINKFLLLFISYLACMFLYNSIKYREAYRQLKGMSFLTFRIMPFIVFPLGFIYLFGCLHYLTHFPAIQTIGKLPAIAGSIYTAYVLYYLVRMLFFYAKSLRTGFTGQTLKQTFHTIITLSYDCTLLYFFFQIYAAMKMQ